MKKTWNKVQNNFKEFIRLNTKQQLAKDSQNVYKRTYDNIDITKDFENRQKRYSLSNIANKNLIKEPNYDLMSLEELENCYLTRTIEEEIEKSSDLNKKILITGIRKECILSGIHILEFNEKQYTDSNIHPKIKEQMEKIHYCLIHNLPIEKRVLYEGVPQYFVNEIAELSEEERLMFPRQGNKVHLVGEGHNNITFIEHQNKKLLEYSVEKRLKEMERFIDKLESEIYSNYEVFFKQAVEDWNWISMNDYLLAIKKKDKENLTYGERLIREALEEISHMKKENQILRKAYKIKKENELNHLEMYCPINPELKEIFDGINDYTKKFRTFKIQDTKYLPYNPEPADEEEIINSLRKNKYFDIDEIIENDNKRYLSIINSGLAIEPKDSDEKDSEMIKRINLIQEVIKMPSPVNHGKSIANQGSYSLDFYEENMMGSIPDDGRIQVDELYKVLFLNEEDNNKYDFNYWCEYFNIDKATLRNIFNYVFFPVMDFNKKGEVNRILYFKDKEYEERRKLISQMTADEYEQYLIETDDRQEIKELKRLEYLDFVKAAKEPRITERTVVFDPYEQSEKIERQLVYSEAIIEIDRKIAEVTSGKLESSSQFGDRIDADVKRKIEEMAHIKKLESIRKINIIEDNKIKNAVIEDSQDQRKSIEFDEENKNSKSEYLRNNKI